MLAPPGPPRNPEELEALIREARERQRRRQILFVAGAAVIAAVGLSIWAAIPSRSSRGSAARGGGAVGAGRATETPGRVPITEVGTSGGVTWALNRSGMWLTTNGGRTWRASAPRHVRRLGDLTERIPQVTFLDRDHGRLLFVNLLGGAHEEAFYWTSDGGRTWHRSIPNGCCGEFSFVDRRLGFFAGDSRLYATRNGGVSWKPVGGRFFGSPLAFVDARHGIAMLDGGFLRTADGGRHWTSPLLSGEPPAAGNDTVVSAPVAVFGDRLVLTAERLVPTSNGPDDWRVFPYVSDDGGATWAVRPFPSWWIPYIGTNDANRFSAASGSVWFAAARRELATTTDAGQTWRRVRPVGVPARWIIGTIDFTSARIGWAIFDGPRRSVLMRTTDGGVHWRPAGPRAARHHKRR